MLLDPPTLAAVALVALVAAVIGATGGFGTGIILTAALTPLIGARGLDLQRARCARPRHRARHGDPRLGAASIPGSALGAWLVERVHARLHVLFMEALIVFGGAFMLWHSWR